MDKATLQEYADAIVAEDYRQPLMTVEEACAKVGWEFAEKPICCGGEVETASFIVPGAYKAECQKCHKFIFDVTGPRFSENGGAVWTFPGDKVDGETDKRWIAGERPKC